MPKNHHKKATDAHHHQHLRKRQSQKSFSLSFVDHLVYIAGPLIPIAIAPQAYSVWFGNQVEGLALPTWALLTFTSLSMALYAIVHKEKALIITYIPMVFLNGSIVLGILTKS